MAAERPDSGRTDPDAGVESEGLSTAWRKWTAAADIFAKIAVPIVLAVAGFQVKESIARLDAAPDLLDLALETIAQEPLSQPDGVRAWAVDLLDQYSPVELDSELRSRLKAGWRFQVPFELRAEQVSFRPPDEATATVDGHLFELRFADSGDQVLHQVTLSLPAQGLSVTGERLETTNILSLHVGPAAYLFRFEELRRREGRPVAVFSVWKQSPGLPDEEGASVGEGAGERPAPSP